MREGPKKRMFGEQCCVRDVAMLRGRSYIQIARCLGGGLARDDGIK